MEKINALQTLEFPLFLQSLEKKYGKKFVDQNVASMVVLCEGGAGGLFRTLGNGTTANLMKVAHACIRTVAKLGTDADKRIDERQAVAAIMKTIALHIGGDFAREGVPDAIFNGVMAAKKNESNPDPSSPPIDGITPPLQ